MYINLPACVGLIIVILDFLYSLQSLSIAIFGFLSALGTNKTANDI